MNEQLKNLFDNPVQIAETPQTDFRVLPENWPAIQVFIACQTQWDYLVLPDKAIKAGLKYPSVKIVARARFPNEDQDALFIKIQAVEQHALAIWQDQ